MKKVLLTMFMLLMTVATWADDYIHDGYFLFKKETAHTVSLYSHTLTDNVYSLQIPNKVYDEYYNEYDVTSIGRWALTRIYADEIVIPEGVETIGEHALDISNVKRITFPSTIKSIASDALNGLTITEKVIWGVTDPAVCGDVWNNATLAHHVRMVVKKDVADKFRRTENFKYLQIVPEGDDWWELSYSNDVISVDKTGDSEYTIIGLGMFKNKKNTIIRIGCTWILSGGVNTQYKNKSVAPYAFCGEKYFGYKLDEGIERLDDYAFKGCKAVYVDLPSTITSVGNSAFEDMEWLETVVWRVKSPATVACPFTGNKGVKIFVPEDALDAYRTAVGWKDCDIQAIFYDLGSTSYFDYITYIITGTNEAYAVGMTAGNISDITIAGKLTKHNGYKLNEYKVKGIASVFADDKADFQSNLSLTIDEGVEIIGERAFNGLYFRRLTLPSTLTKIGKEALDNLQPRTIIWKVADVNRLAFPFYNNEYIKYTIYVPASSLDDYMAAEPWNKHTLKSVDMVERVVENGIVYHCYGNGTAKIVGYDEDYMSDDLYIKSWVYTDVGDNTLEYNVIGIEPHAFEGCKSIKQITVPETFTYIGDYAFAGCKNLTYFYIPEEYDNLESVGNAAFKGCDGLNTLHLECNKTKIAKDAFEGCKNLNFIRWNKNTYSSSYNGFCFADVENKSKCIIGVPLEEVNTYAAKDGWKEFDIRAISGLEGDDGTYKYVTIHEMYANIAGFSDGVSLNEVKVKRDVEIDGKLYNISGVGNYAFCNNYDIRQVTFPSGDEGAYYYVKNRAFYGCENLRSINVPQDVILDIGQSAFAECNTLAGLKAHTSYVADYAFENCSALRNVDIKTYYISSYSFRNCMDLETVTLRPDGDGAVIGISEFAFKDCRSLKSFYSYAPVYSVGKNAFENCVSLETFGLPVSADYPMFGMFSYIGNEAFNICTKLKNIYVPDYFVYLGEKIFNNTAIERVSVPDVIRMNGDNVFEGCGNVKEFEVRRTDSSFGFNGQIVLKIIDYGHMPQLKTIVWDVDYDGLVFYNDYRQNPFNHFAYNDVTVYVPDADVEKYDSSSDWDGFIIKPMSSYVPPVGVKAVNADSNAHNGSYYNLAGQRVGSDYRGVVVGKKKMMIRK